MTTEYTLDDLSIEQLDATTAREFIIEHHYSGSCHNGPMAWGCFNGDTLVGVIAFATPISENVRRFIWHEEYEDEMKDHTTELHRLVTLDETPHNTESWFISRGLDALKEYKPKYKAVLSHADSEEGHDGTIYKASNAMYTGTTGSERLYYKKPDGSLCTPRVSGENITIDEAEERGWEKVYRGVKHRYIFVLPDPYEHKDDIRAKMSIEEMDYI